MTWKQPGQVAHDAYFDEDFKTATEIEQQLWREVESAVLAAARSERPAGVWIEQADNEVQSATFLALSQVVRVSHIQEHWEVEAFTPDGDGRWMITEGCARRIVEAIGGTWPEDAK